MVRGKLVDDAEHDGTMEDTHDKNGISEEVRHGVGNETGSKATFANDEDDGDDAEEDHGTDTVQEGVVQTNDAVIAAHKDGGSEYLEPGGDIATSKLFHEKSAHRQFFGKGQEETNEHHERAFPTEGEEALDRMGFAPIGKDDPECAVDNADDDGGDGGGTPPAQLSEGLAVLALPEDNESDDDDSGDAKGNVQVERGQE